MDFTLTHAIAGIIMLAGVSGSHWMNKVDIAVNETKIQGVTRQLDRIEDKIDMLFLEKK